MGMFTWRSSVRVSFYLFSLFTCNVSATSTQLMSNPMQDDDIDIDICKMVFCGKGTCHLSQTEFLGFGCDCDSGWKKFNIGSFEFPPCVIPNCTVDLQCGNGSSQPPPPVQPPNVSDPCLLNLCGDGTCVRSGGFEFRCQCNEGSANLLNDPKMLCLKKCALGGDCNGLGLGFTSPEAGTSPPATPNSGSASPGTGSGKMLNYSRELYMLTVMILATIFQNWT